jgi:hypothetical protein
VHQRIQSRAQTKEISATTSNITTVFYVYYAVSHHTHIHSINQSSVFLRATGLQRGSKKGGKDKRKSKSE